MESTVSKKIKTFFHTFKHKTSKKGEILIRADEVPSGIFYLQEGFVKEYFVSKKGEEVIVNIFKPGTFFPVSFAMNKTVNLFYFEAMTSLSFYKAPMEQVIDFLKKNPDVVYDLLRRVYLGTDGLLLRVAYLMSGSAQQRLVTELIIHARRFGEYKETNTVELSISETDLANQTGLTRETVSREFKRLKDNELAVFSKGKIIIPSLKKLESSI